jgi:hypothetical protein
MDFLEYKPTSNSRVHLVFIKYQKNKIIFKNTIKHVIESLYFLIDT